MRHRLHSEPREIWNHYVVATVFGKSQNSNVVERRGVKGQASLNNLNKFAIC